MKEGMARSPNYSGLLSRVHINASNVSTYFKEWNVISYTMDNRDIVVDKISFIYEYFAMAAHSTMTPHGREHGRCFL